MRISDWSSDVCSSDLAGYRKVSRQPLVLQSDLAAAIAERDRLHTERDEARGLVIEANNSLFGSQGYFHSSDGGAYDRYHLARAIEDLKARSRKSAAAIARAEAAERDALAKQARIDALMMEYCPDEITGEQLENWMVAQRPVPEPERYVTLKATGSRYAYVNDTQAGKTVKRYDIFRRYGGRDGWICASEHAASLNAIAAQQVGRGGGMEELRREYGPDGINGEQLENGMVAQRPVPEPERYVTLKATGSRYAYVNDTQAGKTVKRYDIFRRYGGRDGWICASEHAASLNAIAAQQAEGEDRG